jgi:hypothetical protein
MRRARRGGTNGLVNPRHYRNLRWPRSDELRFSRNVIEQKISEEETDVSA